MRIALVYENSQGLRHDVRVLRGALGELSRARLEFVDVCLDWGEAHHRAEAAEGVLGLAAPIDVVIFFEITNDHPLLLRAKRKIMLPNPECLEPRFLDVARQCDVIWHKTNLSRALLEPILPMVQHRTVGFTSAPPGVQVASNDQVLHIKGARATKRNTDVILRCWLQHPDWPRLTVLSHDPLPSLPARLPPNLRVRHGLLRRQRFMRFYRDHGIHLCTSECEGFGHYINEARAAGALVIATDAPPMNELITSRSGVLVEAESGTTFNQGMAYPVNMLALSRAVHAALALSRAERERMTALGQCLYWRDRHRFFGRLLSEVAGWLE